MKGEKQLKVIKRFKRETWERLREGREGGNSGEGKENEMRGKKLCGFLIFKPWIELRSEQKWAGLFWVGKWKVIKTQFFGFQITFFPHFLCFKF